MKKTALVTGASRGIGAKNAELLAIDGYNVIVNYLNSEQQALALAEKIGGMAYKADVSDYAQVSAMVTAAEERFGKIDLLVNNAAISVCGLFTDISDSDAARIFEVNVMGAMNCARAVLPMMINRKCGKIINISSMWGEVGASCEVHYSAAKAAVIGFTKALAKEVGPSGIQVNCVSPGVIMTDMNKALTQEDINALIDETPLMRVGQPEDIARTVCFLASANADFITGQIIGVNGGMII